ncbi:L-serine dehydratase, alpha chain [Slackia heliotrinireducens]|uniref:L-serine ammonia-lyase, iron-sulfur-dependent, subunit alpha n=1 Tax=Slackia heliotrinireducens TaxID=84110 RepID=UPI0001A35C9B|nr:L-serine ammonia-lyase, iron-sulfur-dependent, subunit alpha [Slackia heliotrinireducens]VEH01210.1 L-serine dehydratase, alpha chain [Slackia heliotrinireducens]
MKALGIRDIIGPIMIGPSSSHTAGALRIASMCRRLLSAEPAQVTFTLYGSFAHTSFGHGTDRALLAGLLGMAADDIRIRNSFQIAEQAGLAFEFIPNATERVSHPNTVDIHVVDVDGTVMDVRGESIGGGAAVITRINGVDVRLDGEYHSLVISQKDAKGVLAYIANCLNVFGINIATTRMYRKRKGDVAFTIMQTDDEIPEAAREAICCNPLIFDARIIKSDLMSDTRAPVRADEADTMQGFGVGMDPHDAEVLFEQIDFASAADLLAYCNAENLALSEAICRRERCILASNGIAVDDTKHYLQHALAVMRESVTTALDDPSPSMGGLLGGEARKLADFDGGIGDSLLSTATRYAMAVLETNASMGRIVAAPTAGSSGVVPAVLFSCQDRYGFDDEQVREALACAAAVGYIITRNATVSGAEGGCQAEVGAASAMAAAAAVQLFGGTPEQCLNAAGNAIVGLMGLVCDPVAGLVEVPCQKRNATGAANALVSAQIALAGIGNMVDFDQTVEAMHRVGKSLPFELRESALGGLANTPAACAYCESRR